MMPSMLQTFARSKEVEAADQIAPWSKPPPSDREPRTMTLALRLGSELGDRPLIMRERLNVKQRQAV